MTDSAAGPSTDRYRRQFGEVAIDLGYVDDNQVQEALELQAERRAAGRPDKLLGQLLLELGHLSTGQIQEVVDVLYPASKDAPPAN